MPATLVLRPSPRASRHGRWRRGRADRSPSGRARRASRRRGRGTERAPTSLRESERVADVAEHDQRVAPQPPRIATGDVPPTVAVETAVVVGVEQVEHVDPRLHVAVEHPGVATPQAHGRRARLLAVVAAVDAVADRLAQRERDRPGRCSTQARHRLASMTPGRDDRPGRARRRCSAARSAAVGDRCRGRERRRRDDAAEHEPAAGPGNEEVGVLAEPAEPAAVGDLAVDDRVVVGERHGPLAGGPEARAQRPSARPAAGRSGRPTRSGRRVPAHPAAGVGRSSSRYERAATRIDCAPGTACCGSVERAGLR